MRHVIQACSIIRCSLILAWFCFALSFFHPGWGKLVVLPILSGAYGQWLCGKSPVGSSWARASLLAPLAAISLAAVAPASQSNENLVLLLMTAAPLGALFFLIFLSTMARKLNNTLQTQATRMLMIYSSAFAGTVLMVNDLTPDQWNLYFCDTIMAVMLVSPVALSGLLGRMARALTLIDPELTPQDPTSLPHSLAQ